jgi:hypothetical protein
MAEVQLEPWLRALITTTTTTTNKNKNKNKNNNNNNNNNNRSIRGPSLTEMLLCGAYLYIHMSFTIQR